MNNFSKQIGAKAQSAVKPKVIIQTESSSYDEFDSDRLRLPQIVVKPAAMMQLSSSPSATASG